MKLISYEISRLLWLVVMDEIRPWSGSYMPEVYNRIRDRYLFVAAPKDVEDAIRGGAKFLHGTFQLNGEQIAVHEMGIYSDGIIIGASTTDHADAIADDLISWAVSDLRLRPPSSVRPRTYTSNLIVDFDKIPHGPLVQYEVMSRRLSAALKASRGWDLPIELQRLAFQADPTNLLPHMMPQTSTQFAIERRAGMPFSDNRFWSTAPLRTREHINVLELIEHDLASTK
jgi:hypothetical protein